MDPVSSAMMWVGLTAMSLSVVLLGASLALVFWSMVRLHRFYFAAISDLAKVVNYERFVLQSRDDHRQHQRRPMAGLMPHGQEGVRPPGMDLRE